jgi:hypothetical protein
VTRRFYECRPANSYEISTGDNLSVEQRLQNDFVRSFEKSTIYFHQIIIIQCICGLHSETQLHFVYISLL